VTSDILRRVWVHKSEAVDGFAKTYGIHLLVYVEFFGAMPDAILREKQIKKWQRAWKVELIERANPQWRDLYEELQR
jgi:putative endonuclease